MVSSQVCNTALVVVAVLLVGERICTVNGRDTLQFVFRGAVYLNNSYILLSEVDTTNLLICITTRTDCCTGNNQLGEFHFPNGNTVPTRAMVRNNRMYRERGVQKICLGRVSVQEAQSSPSALAYISRFGIHNVITNVTGLYWCDIPDSIGNGQRIYINIVTVTIVPITSSGTNSVGQQFNLTCTATVEGSLNTPTITWLDGNNMTVPSGGGDITRMVSTVMSSGSTHTSILQFNPLQSSHAEMYTCQVSLGTVAEMKSIGVTILRFEFKGVNYFNNSYILLDDIDTVNLLICTTTRADCCTGDNAVGEFHFPNGNLVPTRDAVIGNRMYGERGDQQIRLGRVPQQEARYSPAFDSRTGISNVFGLYWCDIPDSSGNSQRIYMNIVKVFTPSVTLSGNNTAGQHFNLTCTATVEGSTDTPTFTWLDGNNMTIPSEGGDTRMVSTVMSSGYTYTSILQFDPLQSSHAGTYTCQVSVGTGTEMGSIDITVAAPPITVIVSGGTPTAGQSYSLTCTVSGADQLNPVITYQWFKTNPETQVGTNSSTLSFTPLRLSDAGKYRCDVTVSSTYLRQDISAMSDTEDLRITTVLIQLHMNGLFNCHEWALTDTSTKINEVIDTLVTAVETECQCGFTKHQITDFAFKCFPESETHVTFRARLTNTSKATVPQLISHVEQWLLSTKTIAIQMFLLELETTCGLLITDLGDPECPYTIQQIGDVNQTKKIFQLKFGSTEHCITWNSDKAKKVQSDIHNEILKALTSRCQCTIPEDNILKGVFSCQDSQDQTTYRSTIAETQSNNATELVEFIQDWVHSRPTMTIQWYTVKVDHTCPVHISSLDDPECGTVQ